MEPEISDEPSDTESPSRHTEVKSKPTLRTRLKDPDERLVGAWMWVVCLSSILTCFISFLMVSFTSTSPDTLALVYLCDVVYLAYIVHKFHLRYKDAWGIPIEDELTIVRNYLKSGFLFDLLSIVPFEVAVIVLRTKSTSRTLSVLRLNRLLRFWRVMTFLEERELDFESNTKAIRAFKYCFLSLLCIHIITCGWFALACVGEFSSTSGVYCAPGSWANDEHISLGFNMSETTMGHAYLVSMYFAVATATSVGYGDIAAEQPYEKLYSTMSMLFGVAVFLGILLGGMTSMLANFYQKRADFVLKFENIKLYLKEELVPSDLQKQVIDYYEYFWKATKGLHLDDVYSNMPLSLQAEICHATNHEIIQKAPIFTTVSTGFMRMLSLKLQHQHYLPNQLIIARGQFARHMIIVHKGEVEILSEDDDETPVATLKDGAVIGEVNLLQSLPKEASVRAKTHCEIMTLSQSDVRNIMDHYPDDEEKLKWAIRQRYVEAMAYCQKTKSQGNIQEKPSRKSLSGISKSRTSIAKAILDNLKGSKRRIVPTTSFELMEQSDGDDVQIITPSNNYICSTIDPDGRTAYWWRYYVILMTVVISTAYPYIVCFLTEESYGSGWAVLLFTYYCDGVLVADIFVNLRMKIVTEHETIEDFRSTARHYCSSVRFIIDILAVLPLEVLSFLAPVHKRMEVFFLLRLNRVIKFIQIPKLCGYLEEGLSSSIIQVRIIKFLTYIFLLTHWTACAFYASACFGYGCSPDSWYGVWMSDYYENTTRSSPVVGYMVSMYLSSATLTSTGYGDISARTQSDRLVASFFMVLGTFLYGYALASMAATLATDDKNRVRYQERLLSIENFMKKHHLPNDIEKRVVDCLGILWDKYKGCWLPGMPHILHDVPVGLQEDIALMDAYRTIALCPLFKDADESFLKQVALKAQPFLFRKGEIVTYAGEISYEMYSIRRGYCEIRTPDNEHRLWQIGPGEYFGDVEMLFGQPRYTTVVARTAVEVLELKYSDLKAVLEGFPLIEAQFNDVINNREKYRHLLKGVLAHYPGSTPQLQLDRTYKRIVTDHQTARSKYPFLGKSYLSFYKTTYQVKKELEEGYKDMSFFGRILKVVLMRIALNPTNRNIHMASALLMVLTTVQAFTIPLQAAFYRNNITWLLVHYSLDLLNLINIYVRSHLAYYTEDDVIVVTHPAYALQNYLRTNFLLDLFASLPYELLILTAGLHTFYEYRRVIPLLRFNRLLSVYHVQNSASYYEAAVSRSTESVRGVKFFIYTILFINFVTCASYIVASPPYVGDKLPEYFDNKTGLIAQSWPYYVISSNNINLDDAVKSVTIMYTICLYWAVATALSVGYGDISAYYPSEMVFATVIMVLGILYFGYLVASLAAGMVNADTQRGAFADKLQAIKAYLEDHDVEEDLRQRILSHYKYLYTRTKGINPKLMFDALPQTLWGDLCIEMYKSFIQEMSLFQNTNPAFVKLLCKCIQPALIRSGEFIVRKNDIGDEMFFIHRGVVEVISQNGRVVFDTMSVGETFGEVAILYNCRRTATIRAKTNCDLFVLYKTDLDRALESFPDVRKTIQLIARQRMRQARERGVINAKKSRLDISSPEIDELRTMFSVPLLDSDDSISSGDDITQQLLESDDEDLVEIITTYPGIFIVNWLKNKVCFVINRNNKNLDYFNKLMCVLGLVSCIMVSFQFAFQEHDLSVIVTNYVCDGFFVIHIFLKFHTCYYTEEGDLISDLSTIVSHYLKDYWNGFLRDLISVFPIEAFALVVPAQSRMLYLSGLRLPRLLRVLNVLDYFRQWEQELEINILVVRLCKNLVTLVLGIHVMSSVWYAQACLPWRHPYCEQDSWIKNEHHELTNTMSEYFTCVYWCVATITSTGYGDVHAYTLREMILAAVVMVVGTLMFGFVLGNIVSSLQSAEANRLKYEERMSAVTMNMKDQHVPRTLSRRVLAFLSHSWIRTKGADVQTMFMDCPPCLRSELAFSVCRPMLNAVPFFEHAEDSFLREISLRVTQTVFLPNDYIVKKGDVGDSMLYIRRGEVDIILDERTMEVYTVLKQGQVFGEISVLAKMARLATVRARTHMDLFCLSKKDLDEVLDRFPEFKETMERDAMAIYGNFFNK